MTFPTQEDFENAKIDVDHVSDIVNGSTTVTTRLGGDKLSVDQALSQIIVGEVAVYNAAATYTNIEDWVEYNGVVYRPLPSELPIGPEAFDSSHWSVAQGFATADNVELTVNSLTRDSLQSYLENKEVPDYTALIALAPIMGIEIADGDVCYVTNTGIAGEGVFRNVASHGLTYTSGAIVVINTDWYWERSDKTGINPSMFEAGRDDADYSSELQSFFDYCSDNNIPATGYGTYYTGSTVEVKSDFISQSEMVIEPTSDFASGIPVDFDELGRRVVIISNQGARIVGLMTRNGNGVADLVGMDYSVPQIKSWRSGGNAFRVNNLVRNFSVSIYEGRGINGGSTGKGLVAYAPDFSNEINALNIHGGEWFGNNAGAIDIGDRDGLFSTSLTSSDYMGNSIGIWGYPTLDQGFLSVDQVIDVEVEAYFENGGAGLEKAVRIGGVATNSVRGFKISGYARDFDYYVFCESACSGIDMQNCFSRSIDKSALYLVSDQFGFTYNNNTQISSFTEGQEVHTGVRAGLTSYLFNGDKNIGPYGMVQGDSTGQHSDHIYRNRVDVSQNEIRNYLENSSARQYGRSFLPGTGTANTANISGSTATFSTNADIQPYNGGDIVTIGAAICYIRVVDYLNLTATLQLLSGGSIPTGSQTITQNEIIPLGSGMKGSIPSITDMRQGSIINNQNMTVGQPVGWAYDGTSWNALANL
ncbi:MAG: hypothetical protein ACN2B6_01425 [Rickettsiales bacterium]